MVTLINNPSQSDGVQSRAYLPGLPGEGAWGPGRGHGAEEGGWSPGEDGTDVRTDVQTFRQTLRHSFVWTAGWKFSPL